VVKQFVKNLAHIMNCDPKELMNLMFDLELDFDNTLAQSL
jgi:hypothetical protein